MNAARSTTLRTASTTCGSWYKLRVTSCELREARLVGRLRRKPPKSSERVKPLRTAGSRASSPAEEISRKVRKVREVLKSLRSLRLKKSASGNFLGTAGIFLGNFWDFFPATHRRSQPLPAAPSSLSPLFFYKSYIFCKPPLKTFNFQHSRKLKVINQKNRV